MSTAREKYGAIQKQVLIYLIAISLSFAVLALLIGVMGFNIPKAFR